jgi:hypothetical protein
MSADAKVWFDDDTSRWEGLHDGECGNPNSHFGLSYDLVDVLRGIEQCMGVKSLRWVLRSYPNGQLGLCGYET